MDKAEKSLADAARILAENDALKATIVELRARAVMLEQLADTDPLVPLPNRRAFYRAVRQVIADVADGALPAALLFVDLDGLKRTNDAHGHRAGDALLRHVAELLKAGLDGSDMAARIGGDEFGVLITDCDEVTAQAKALSLTHQISKAPLNLGTVKITPTISIGLTVVRGDDTPDTVVDRADAAMYAHRSER